MAQNSGSAEATRRPLYARAKETAGFLQHRLPDSLKSPKVAIICGSGLGGLQHTVNAEPKFEISYEEIPNWAQSTDTKGKTLGAAEHALIEMETVAGHDGKLVFGTIGSSRTPVVLLVGRAHFYEGHSMQVCTFAVRTCKVLAVETIIVTNAAGALNPSFSVGDIVVLNDHLNIPGMVGESPLRGPNDDDFGVRFPPLSDAYDLELRRRAHLAWRKLGLDGTARKMHEGIYAFLAGPTYETRAECRMLRLLGADLVGMSTVPEIVVARHSGVRVLALSLVTNKAVLEAGPRGDAPEVQELSREELIEYMNRGMASHEEVLEAGRLAAQDMQAIVRQILEDLYV